MESGDPDSAYDYGGACTYRGDNAADLPACAYQDMGGGAGVPATGGDDGSAGGQPEYGGHYQMGHGSMIGSPYR